MVEIRCKKCKGLLMMADYGSVEIKCRKCGYINRFVITGKEKKMPNREDRPCDRAAYR